MLVQEVARWGRLLLGTRGEQAGGALWRVVLATGPGVEHAYVTGAGPTQHDLDPIFSHDLTKGESIALPVALLVLLGVFGFSVAVTMPFIFAACTITGALGVMYWVARLTATPTPATSASATSSGSRKPTPRSRAATPST